MSMRTRKASLICSVLALVAVLGDFIAPRAAFGVAFEIVVLPDTQNYSQTYPATFQAQTQWIANNVASENIVFVTHLGDVVNVGNDTAQWAVGQNAMNTLNGVVPYSTSFGNHDLDYPTVGAGVENCKNYFGDAVHQGGSTYGGAAPNGLSFYQTFSAGGYNLLNLNLNYNPDSTTLAWADSILKANSNRLAIISTHDYLDPSTNTRSTQGTSIWNSAVYNNPNVLMVLNGHYSGESQLVSQDAAGKNVLQMVSDYQDGANGGDGYLRKIRFDPAAGQIQVKTYSPTQGFQTDANSQFAYSATFNQSTNSVLIGSLYSAPAASGPLVGWWRMNETSGTSASDSSAGWYPSWQTSSTTPVKDNGVLAEVRHSPRQATEERATPFP